MGGNEVTTGRSTMNSLGSKFDPGTQSIGGDM